MNAIYFFTNHHFVSLKEVQGKWELSVRDVEVNFVSFAYDQKASRVYAGSFDHGLWMSDDEGAHWVRIAEELLPDRIMSLAVSPHENTDRFQTLWLGSEPSALYRSDDGGKTWIDFPALLELPSASSWSFPPRPHTHHVRTIQIDPHDGNRIFVGIELGGVMQSDDQGLSWQDRKPGSQYDVHSLTMTASAPGRIYEAAGGGYAYSTDNGASWETDNEGLGDYTYLVNLAVNQSDPDRVIASAARSPCLAYQPARAESVLVVKDGGESWRIIENGLPESQGSTTFHLMADPSKAHHFYAINNKGFYQSEDGGLTWQEITVDWPDALTHERIYACQLVEV